MSDLYQIMHARLVGQVDTALDILEDMITEQNFNWNRTMQAAVILKNALLETENFYIEHVKEPPRLIIINPQKNAGI